MDHLFSLALFTCKFGFAIDTCVSLFILVVLIAIMFVGVAHPPVTPTLAKAGRDPFALDRILVLAVENLTLIFLLVLLHSVRKHRLLHDQHWLSVDHDLVHDDRLLLRILGLIGSSLLSWVVVGSCC